MARPKTKGQIASKAMRLRPWTLAQLNKHKLPGDRTLDDVLKRMLKQIAENAEWKTLTGCSTPKEYLEKRRALNETIIAVPPQPTGEQK